MLGARARRCARRSSRAARTRWSSTARPGSGKTTLARIVATRATPAFEELSAVEAGRAEVREVLERADERRQGTGEPTIFFLDEIHRFNKAQQDALLPAVEEGLVTLIGATTENPYFEVNSALLSRAPGLRAAARSTDADVEVLLRRALDRGECGGARGRPTTSLAFLAARAGGDARTALAALELACETAAEASRSRSSAPRTRCSAARSPTTSGATATTTRSRPGSSRRAARTPTPRCTTSR